MVQDKEPYNQMVSIRRDGIIIGTFLLSAVAATLAVVTAIFPIRQLCQHAFELKVQKRSGLVPLTQAWWMSNVEAQQ